MEMNLTIEVHFIHVGSLSLTYQNVTCTQVKIQNSDKSDFMMFSSRLPITTNLKWPPLTKILQMNFYHLSPCKSGILVENFLILRKQNCTYSIKYLNSDAIFSTSYHVATTNCDVIFAAITAASL